LNILAIDPGVSIGVAVKIDSKIFTAVYSDPRDLFELIQENSHVLNYIIIEKFSTAGNISKYGLYTIEVVGGVKALCLVYSIRCILQTPQQRLPFMDDAAKYTRKEHEQDALAHLLRYEHALKTSAK